MVVSVRGYLAIATRSNCTRNKHKRRHRWLKRECHAEPPEVSTGYWRCSATKSLHFDSGRISTLHCRFASKRRAVSFVGNNRQTISSRFGAALRDQRKKLGLTQEQLSAATGLNRSFISEVECGRANISLDRAEILANALNSQLVDLLQHE